MSYKAYVGIGNPDTPYTVQNQISGLASKLEDLGFTLRSDGGQGGSEAFLRSVKELKEIIIPWKKFNGQESKFCKNKPEAVDIVRKFAPSFDTLKESVQAIIASKAHLVLGPDLLQPAKFLVCWSSDGIEDGKKRTAKTGYVGTPLSIAGAYDIPIFNLKNPDALDRLKQFLAQQ